MPYDHFKIYIFCHGLPHTNCCIICKKKSAFAVQSFANICLPHDHLQMIFFVTHYIVCILSFFRRTLVIFAAHWCIVCKITFVVSFAKQKTLLPYNHLQVYMFAARLFANDIFFVIHYIVCMLSFFSSHFGYFCRTLMYSLQNYIFVSSFAK